MESADREDDESIELTVSKYSCSSAIDMRGFDNAFHHYTLVISARLNSIASQLYRYKSMLQAEAKGSQGRPDCDVRCQLKIAATQIINESQPIIDQ